MMENEVIIGHGSLLWIKHYHMSYLNSKWLFGGGGPVSNTHEGGHGKVLRDHGEHESRTHDIISGWSFNQ